MVRIQVTEDPNTVRVEYLGRVHTGVWDDEENIDDVEGDESILRAAVLAWDGQEGVWEISPDALELTSQGHWSASA